MSGFATRTALVLAGFLLLIAVVNQTLNPGDDPYRCKAVLNTGRWVDPPNDEGHHKPFKQWQPDGCKLHHYTSKDIRHCMGGRHIMFSGDSTTRQIAYAMGRLLERKEADYDRDHVDFHSSFNLTYHGVEIQQHWKPFLQIDGDHDSNMFRKQLELIRDQKENPQSIKDQKSPGLSMVGVGAWFSKPEPTFEEYGEALSNVSDIIPEYRDFYTQPMDAEDGIGNHVFFAPPAGPFYVGDKEDKIKDKARAGKKIFDLQDYIREHESSLNFHNIWAVPDLVETDNATWVDPKVTGFHVIDEVAEIKANILLNARCNARLDRIKGYPFERTCCTDYGNKPFVQLVLVGAALAYLVICLGLETLDLLARRTTPRSQVFNMETGAFVLALLLCYYADRTQMFAKGERVFSIVDFWVMCAPCVLLGLVTVRKSAAPRAKPGALNVEQDQPFLSRDQTEEWKGWMQFVILAYHWTSSARSAGVYIFVRLLVAAYLFQTGYGHTTYFLTKKDFSFKRFASVMLRLNLLSVSLAYFMNTDYMFYYFSPLCTFWTVIIYLTLAFRHKQLNDDTQMVVAKIAASAAIMAFIILATPAMGWLFGILRFFFHINWDLEEWNYRVALDMFIVYIGMLAALAYLKCKEDFKFGLRVTLAMVGAAVMGGYGYACTTTLVTVSDYRLWHPFISFIPVLGFIAVRNVSGRVRNYYSTAMAWLGKCSLETYTLQFHLFLAADTQGILLLDHFNGGDGSLMMDRWRSLLFIIPMFVWISSVTASATGNIVKIITTTSEDPSAPLEEEKDLESDGMYNPEAGLLGRGRTAVNKYMKQMPSARSVAYSLQTRVLLILLAMWVMNLMSIVYDTKAPDGYTPHNAGSSKAAPAPPAASGA